MQDMLVSLLNLPNVDDLCKKLEKKGIKISRAMTPNMYHVTEFVEKVTGLRAKGEATVCFSRNPVSCFIATKGDEIIGYACYEATMKDYFGPTEVLEKYQKMGIGTALLVRCLEGLRDMGYAYAIIGGVGPKEFYKKTVGATLIKDSNPGVYKDML